MSNLKKNNTVLKDFQQDGEDLIRSLTNLKVLSDEEFLSALEIILEKAEIVFTKLSEKAEWWGNSKTIIIRDEFIVEIILVCKEISGSRVTEDLPQAVLQSVLEIPYSKKLKMRLERKLRNVIEAKCECLIGEKGMEIKDLLIIAVGSITAGLAILKYVIEWERENITCLLNFRTALENELNLMGSWANPYPDSSIIDYKKRVEFDSFWSPARVIFKFDYPTIKSLLSSTILRSLNKTVVEVAMQLLQSVENLYQYHSEYREFVKLFPEYYLKFSSDENRKKALKNGDEIEKSYLEKVYIFNYTLHHTCIGNGDSLKNLYYYHSVLSEKISEVAPVRNILVFVFKALATIVLTVGLLCLFAFIYKEISIIL